MAKQVQFRRGSETENDNFTGASGEITVNTTNKSLRVHDGIIAGGTALETYVKPSAEPISYITNLQTTLDAKESADATILKDADIGVTVQSYDATIVVDADIGVTVQAYDADIATNADVSTAISSLVDSAPGTLDTLNELAAALGDDPNHVTTMTTLIGTKADQTTTYTKTEVDNGFLSSSAPVLTGNLDGAGNTYTNLHPNVVSSYISSTYALDMTVPVYSLNLTSSTTFSISNAVTGRMSVVGFSHAASSVPTFPSGVYWANDEEPTWADHTVWLVSMTSVSSTVIAASATGFTV
jgi:hypothetical protein